MTDSVISGGMCPICKKKEAIYDERPFCSKTCREIDLMRWLNGDYAVPAVEPPDDFDGDIELALANTEAETEKDIH